MERKAEAKESKKAAKKEARAAEKAKKKKEAQEKEGEDYSGQWISALGADSVPTSIT